MDVSNLHRLSENQKIGQHDDAQHDAIDTKNGEGVLRVYEGRESGGDFTGVTPQVYEGFARIVDVEYKERIY